MKQCTCPIGAGCSHIYRRIYRYNPEIHGDLYLYNIYLNSVQAAAGGEIGAAADGKLVWEAAVAERVWDVAGERFWMAAASACGHRAARAGQRRTASASGKRQLPSACGRWPASASGRRAFLGGKRV
jgi:hypothetical protein